MTDEVLVHVADLAEKGDVRAAFKLLENRLDHSDTDVRSDWEYLREQLGDNRAAIKMLSEFRDQLESYWGLTRRAPHEQPRSNAIYRMLDNILGDWVSAYSTP